VAVEAGMPKGRLTMKDCRIKAGTVAYIKATEQPVFVLEVFKAGWRGGRTFPGFSHLIALVRFYDYFGLAYYRKLTV
jgi:hypothetical protein